MHSWQNLASALSVSGTGLLLLGVGLAANRLLRYCRHKRMGWPIRRGQYTYQACLDCGMQRPFDETRFESYGNYSYDITQAGSREGL
jgi:hypothetical protein